MALPAILGAGDPKLVLDVRAGYPSGRTFTRSSQGTWFDAAGVRQTAANDIPRIDRHPTTHDALGLLMERSVANRLLNSEAPASQTTGSLNPATYCLWVEGSGSATSSAGTATGTGFGAATAGSPNVFTLTGAGTVTVTVTGSLTRFQLEQNTTVPTSYILTTGATVTRQSDFDAASVVPWLSTVAGTFVVEGRTNHNNPTVNGGPFVVDDGTDNNRSGLRHSAGGNALTMITVLGGSTTINQIIGTIVPGSKFRAGFTYAASGWTSAMNGAAGASGAQQMSPNLWTTYRLGQVMSSAQQFGGWVSRLWYFPRALPQAELNAWTR